MIVLCFQLSIKSKKSSNKEQNKKITENSNNEKRQQKNNWLSILIIGIEEKLRQIQRLSMKKLSNIHKIQFLLKD